MGLNQLFGKYMQIKGKKFHYIFLLIFLFPFTLNARINDSTQSRLSYDIAILNEKFTIPFLKYYGSKFLLNPGIRIGTEYRYHNGKYRSNFQSLNLLSYYHNNLHTALILNTEYGERYKSRPGLYADWMIGIGYFQTIYDKHLYVLGSDGEFHETSRWGFPRAVVSVNLGCGYDFGVKTNSPLCIYLKYTFFSEMPFRIGDPFGAHTCIQAGFRISPHKGKSNENN
jgi:hypothetical protein